MIPRARILALTVITVALAVIAVTLVNLNSMVTTLVDSAIERSDAAGRQIQSFVQRRLREVAMSPGAPRDVEGLKSRWREVVATDPDVAAVLEQTMIQTPSFLEIAIAGEDSVILVSSNPSQRGVALIARPALERLRSVGPLQRIAGIFLPRTPYERRFPLGLPGSSNPLFITQILIAPLFLKSLIIPDLVRIGTVSAIALLASVFLAYWSAKLATRPLSRISDMIDEISTGKAQAAAAKLKLEAAEYREVALIESKLNLLGEQFRGAQDDASRLRANLETAMAKLDAESRGQLEAQMMVSRRLVAISSLTSRVAHEIKNPLNSIALRLELLRSRLQDDDEQGEIRVLTEEVGRLDRVVKTFLDFSKPVDLALEPLELSAFVGDLVRFLEVEATERQIQLAYVRPPSPIQVNGDRELLRQALLNIAVNGMEAMTRGGRLEFQLTEAAQGKAELRISDTGPGIPAEQREKIFQLYFTTKPKGTGIGLAMTFRAVQLHGGTIQVESEVGKGSVFCIYLPLSERERA